MTWTLVGQLIVLAWFAGIPLIIVTAIAFDRARGARTTTKNTLHH